MWKCLMKNHLSVMDVKEGITGIATFAAVSALKTMVNALIHHVIR